MRPMADADVEAVWALNTLVQPTSWSVAFLREQLVNPLTHANLIAEIDGRLVGHAAMAMLADEGHVTALSIDPEYQRQGIGRSLLAELCRSALERELTAMTLEVRASNEPAIALYRAFGFAPAGVRPSYYSDPTGLTEDALVMWLHDLDDPVFRAQLALATVDAQLGSRAKDG